MTAMAVTTAVTAMTPLRAAPNRTLIFRTPKLKGFRI